MAHWPQASVLAAVTVALLALVPSARATFPGSNGEIAYVDDQLPGSTFSLRTIHPDGTPSMILLTEHHPPDTFPYDADYSPDGSQIAIVAIGGTLGHDRLLLMDAETGEWDVIFRISRLSQDSFIASVAFSPTGDRLVFCAVDLGGPNRARLLTIAVDGSDVALVSDRPSCFADWSSTDKIVALGGYDLRRIVTMNPDGTNRQTVVPAIDETTSLSFSFDPTWSPDGSRFVYAAPVGARQQYEVFAAAADGSARTRLTDRPLRDDIYPLFSPDGAAIAFTRSRDSKRERGELFMMAADGSNVERLTYTPWSFEFTRSWQALP